MVDNNRAKELKAFDDTKAGVKGLVDSGIVHIPKIFVTPALTENEFSAKNLDSDSNIVNVQIPVIDLKGINEDDFRRRRIVEEVGEACKTWGFFQVVNHSVPQHVMDEMISGVKSFNEQSSEKKMEFYSRDNLKKVKFNSNFDLYSSKAANWRDSLTCVMAPNPPTQDELPEACREELLQYSEHVRKLGHTIFELLAEALGLKPNHLLDMDCAKGQFIISHYYPPCPEPNKTLGITKHTDPDFFTILLQDQIGGLQINHQNQWIDIHPVTGALVINLGDLLQLLSNDKFKSAEHRVLSKQIGPRISIACFFTTQFQPFDTLYGPIKELLSDENHALYKETTVRDYVSYYNSRGLGAHPSLLHLRLNPSI
ncbi:1-aminocyclopropane-1-carboxylate oxidase homolog 1-like isoform X2 [Solanum stenotomum]|uniref:1-aminocyclopropane-1-carboxylate oxidase homolog 1-like isoform X2 n=1 Tax=Solanum stenotomum TaxID=172797 RepID=UPI0020D11CBB|nr:1-aminocyclopropane-1-carboxylate oxidase homolog 1-like isoform X2 [Solanum stenotomum]